MRKLIVLMLVAFLFITTGCSKSKPLTIESLKANYESDKTNIDNATAYIDTLLLIDNKKEAYNILREASENVTTSEELDRLKEFTKYLDIRLVKIESYYNDKIDEISEIRYDDNGRIIQYGDTTRIYLDDGSEGYYYTLSSWTDAKSVYDKNDNLLAVYYGDYYGDENVEKFDDFYYSAILYDYEFDEDEKILCSKETRYLGKEVSWSRETKYSYDANSNLVKKVEYFTDFYDSNSVEYIEDYMYDEHNNPIGWITTNSYGDSYGGSYINSYDEFGKLVNTTVKYNDGYSYSNIYEYDKLYDVILKSSDDRLGLKEYYYELITPDADGIGLNKNAIVIVSGDATRAVKQRIITASNIKLRKTPTTREDNTIGLISKGDIVDVYDSVYGEGYIWHEIGINQWFADDGTWTELYEN